LHILLERLIRILYHEFPTMIVVNYGQIFIKFVSTERESEREREREREVNRISFVVSLTKI
jgi:hypothetical protein